jgi:glycosyltransferase involved in cell wall biosynthesis
MKKILIVAPDCPYPPNHGGRKDVFTRIELYHRLGYHVDLAFTSYEEPDADARQVLESLCGRVIWVPRTKLPVFLPFLQSFQVRSRSKLAKVAFDGEYDLALLESEYVFVVLGNPRLKARRIDLRVHNNESAYYRALAEAAGNPVKKLYFLSEAVYFRITRSAMFGKVDRLNFISFDEYASVADAKKRFVPTYVDPARFKEQQDGGAVLFVGNLFAQNNLAGLRWYLEQVHPKMAGNPAYRLVIAGNTRGSVPGFLQGIADRDPKVTFIDSPTDLSPVYQSGSVFINPMLTGAGVKIKTVDAVANGLPVVSTSVGAEGIGLRDGGSVVIANDPQSFASGIERLLHDKQEAARIFGNARAFLLENYASAEHLTEGV